MSALVPPMPALDCPAWCTEDHAAEWAEHVAACQLVDNEDFIERGWEPVCTGEVFTISLNLPGDEFRLTLDRMGAGATDLYLHARTAITNPSQARILGHALLDAARRLEESRG